MIGFALCHGWAFDRKTLEPLATLLAQRFPDAALACFDLGFGTAAHTPQLRSDVEWIAIGHSYGYAYLIQQPVRWKAAIAINGFTRFCRRPGQPEGTPARLVDAMLARLADDPQATVQDFYLRCGSTMPVPQPLDAPLLAAHLIQLRDLDLALPACQTLALSCRDDLIVPPALAHVCFAQAGCITQEFAGDHMQLLREPALCMAAIIDYVETACA